MSLTSTTSKAVKPVDRSRERPTVPGSEGIDGANEGNDSSATFFEATASCPRPRGPVLLRRRRCNTTSSNTTSVPTSSLGGVASVSQLPPQDGDHFFPLSSNHVPLGTYSGTCPRSQGAALYGTYVHVALAHDRNGPHNLWRLPE